MSNDQKERKAAKDTLARLKAKKAEIGKGIVSRRYVPTRKFTIKSKRPY